MKAKQIILDGKAVYLRLSAFKLAEYANKIGSTGNTLFAVLDALDDLPKQAALFEAALGYNGNPNEIHDGYALIDMLADAEYGPVAVKTLIVQLAQDAGIISNADAAKVTAAIKVGSEKLYEAAAAVLSGDVSGLTAVNPEPEKAEENPT